MAVARQASRSRFTLALLVLTSITLITLDLRGFPPLDGARDAALDLFGPVGDAADSALAPARDTWHGILDYDELEARNEALEERVAELEGETALGADAKETLERLYRELDIDYVGDIPTVVATVVTGPAAAFDQTIEVDRGSADGIEEGMPVVTAAGLVGVVDRVAERRSVVRLITDQAMRVGVRLSEHADVGVARGQGRDQPLLVFTGIDVGLDVAEGELVTTSGLAGTLFPGDVPVGRVRAVVTSAGELDQDLLVDPLADLDALDFVNIMVWEPEP